MKGIKIIFIIISFTLISTFSKSQCVMDIMPPTPINFGSGGGLSGIDVISNNCSWLLIKDETWITVTPASGSGYSTWVDIQCDPNYTPYSRSATITIDNTKQVIVNQAAGSIPPPAAAGAISGFSEICKGSSRTYSVGLISGATSYNWTISNGTISSGQGTRTISATVSTGSSTTISVRGVNSSGSGASSSKVVTVNSLPASPTTGGMSSSCGPKELTLSASTTNESGIGLNWYTASSGGSLISEQYISTMAMGSAFISECTMYFSNTTTLYVSSENGCGESTRSPVTATINSAPVASISTSSNPTSVCPLDGIILSASYGTSYQWRRHGVNISGATNRTYSPTESDTYTVRVTNSCGSTVSSGVVVTMIEQKNLSVSINNPFPVCNNSFMLTAAVANGLGTSVSYKWYVNNVLQNGQTNTFSSASVIDGNKIKCVVTRLSGTCASPSSATSNEVTASFKSVPPVPTTGGMSSNCGPKELTLSASTTNESGIDLNWYTASSGGSLIQEQYISTLVMGTAFISECTMTFGNTTTLYVSSENGCGKSARSPVTATINSAPQVDINYPMADLNSICPLDGFELNATIGTSFQWRQHGVDIPGATNQAYAPTESDTYTVRVNTSCGSSTSNGVQITMEEEKTLRVDINDPFPCTPRAIGFKNKFVRFGINAYI